jgi:hypothetical protein
MRTAIVLQRDATGNVSVAHFDDPLEAKKAFQGLPNTVHSELWNSSAGRIKTRKARAAIVNTPQPAPAQPVKQEPVGAYNRKGR